MTGMIPCNVMLCGFHALTGPEVLNTVTSHSLCSVDFGIIVTLIAIVLFIPPYPHSRQHHLHCKRSLHLSRHPLVHELGRQGVLSRRVPFSWSRSNIQLPLVRHNHGRLPQ